MGESLSRPHLANFVSVAQTLPTLDAFAACVPSCTRHTTHRGPCLLAAAAACLVLSFKALADSRSASKTNVYLLASDLEVVCSARHIAACKTVHNTLELVAIPKYLCCDILILTGQPT